MTGRDHDNLHTAIADGQASVAFVTAAPGLSEKAMERPLTRNDVVSRAKALKNSAALAPIFEILAQWLQILCGLALYYAYPFWWVYIPVVLFVSARQYALAVMLHDAQHTLLHSDKTINQTAQVKNMMKRRQKAAVILIVVIAVALLGLLLPLLPFTEGFGCAGAVNIGCAPDHASASFYLFGSGYLSTPHGANSYYSWCTANLGGGGFACRNGVFQVPW